jgi:hypothetical protein
MTFEIIYQIHDRKTDALQGAYDRSYRTEYKFDSVESARSANVHGLYKNKAQYRIAKYKVTYKLMDADADPATPAEIEAEQKMEAHNKDVQAQMDAAGITDQYERMQFMYEKLRSRVVDDILIKAMKSLNEPEQPAV